ncbi:MAG: ABC transporter permease [Vicinamibacterales bacterium]
MRPPVLARWLLARLLPEAMRDAVAGDLEELFARRVAGGWPSRRAGREFWRLTLRSITDAAGRDDGARGPSGDPMMMTVVEDVRYALRTLGRSPGFAVPALLTMALGIGVTTAVFSLADVLVFRPLPYDAPERLVFLLGWDTARDEMRFNVPHADIPAFDEATPLAATASYQYWSAALASGDVPQRVQGYKVSAGTFDLLGVPAALGRTFTAAEHPGDSGAVVLSDGLWRRAFGADPTIVGRAIRLDGASRVVLGVMPATFEFPVYNFKGELWVPFGAGEQQAGSVVALGRLAPGRTVAEAQAALDAVSARLAEQLPDSHRSRGVRVLPMRELGAGEARPAVAGLLLAVGLLFVLACANITELLLARGAVRHHELATRLALGAGRGRIVRQLLTESLVIALLGAALGVVAAGRTLDAFRAMLPEAILTTLPGIGTLGLDGRTLVVAAGVTMAAGLLAGLAPAWRGARSQALARLGATGRTAGSRRERRLRAALVTTEIALSLALLIAAGLVLRGVGRLLAIDPGFRSAGLLTFSVTLPEARYADRASRALFVSQALERLQALPGVADAAAVNALPFSTYNRGTRVAVDAPASPPAADAESADLRTASPGYFETLGIPLTSGRTFDAADRAGSEPVAVVNDTFARRFLGTADAVGHRVRVGTDPGDWRRIVGTVGDVRHEGLDHPAGAEVYVPLGQAPPDEVMFAVRGAGDPRDLAFPVRRALAAIDPAAPAFHLRPMAEAVAVSAAPQVLLLRLMAAFGVLALLLAAFGVHAVVSQAVSQQRREMAVRVALGASPADLARHVARGVAAPALAGLVIGTAGGLGLGTLLAGLFQGLSAATPQVLVPAVAILLALVAAATIGPTRRAMRPDTAEMLRGE